MLKVFVTTWPLLLGVMLLMVGNGMQGSLLGIRGTAGGFSTYEISYVMSAYFLGFLLGSRRYDTSVPYFALGSVLRVHVHRVLQAENGLGAFDCRIVSADADTDAAPLATATVTVFQPHNVNQFLQDGNVA